MTYTFYYYNIYILLCIPESSCDITHVFTLTLSSTLEFKDIFSEVQGPAVPKDLQVISHSSNGVWVCDAWESNPRP